MKAMKQKDKKNMKPINSFALKTQINLVDDVTKMPETLHRYEKIVTLAVFLHGDFVSMTLSTKFIVSNRHRISDTQW